MNFLEPIAIKNNNKDNNDASLLASVFYWYSNKIHFYGGRQHANFEEKILLEDIADLLTYGVYDISYICKNFSNKQVIILSIVNAMKEYDSMDTDFLAEDEICDIANTYIKLEKLIITCKNYFNETEKSNKRIRLI